MPGYSGLVSRLLELFADCDFCDTATRQKWVLQESGVVPLLRKVMILIEILLMSSLANGDYYLHN